MKIKEGGVMDSQKEREAFEVYIKSIYPMGEQLAKDCGKTLCELYSSEWQSWQAAKAQAVPKGFVVVSQKDLLELTIAINAVDLATHTESKTNEVREMWQQVALKLMALGISQEPAND